MDSFKRRNRIGAVAVVLLVASAVAIATPAAAGPLGYNLLGTAHYTAGCGSSPNVTVGQCGNPDTGWLDIFNNGLSLFSGTATLFGVAPSQTINISFTGTLLPGQDWVFNAGPELQHGWFQ